LHIRDAGPREQQALPGPEALHLEHERGRAVRVFRGSERKAVERRRMDGIGDERERGLPGIGRYACAGVQADPIGDLRRSRERRVEPHRRFIVEHG